MPTKYGSAYDDSDPVKMAPGTMVDAGLRRYRNVFNFAASGVGGTANPLCVAKLARGSALAMARVQTDQNVSGINLSLGIAGTAEKYAAAAAGPNATRQELLIKLGALDDDALEAGEEVILTPSGNWPASGTLVTDVYASHR